MGGRGSGRWRGHWKKNVVEYCNILDVNRWVREGLIKAGNCSSGRWIWFDGRTGEEDYSLGYEADTRDPSCSWVRLYYTFCKTNDHLDYRVSLQVTVPYLGGVRWWFTCPLEGASGPCNRRVGKLYLPKGGRYFGCRRCYDLSYDSCNESHGEIALFASEFGMTPGELKKALREAMGRHR